MEQRTEVLYKTCSPASLSILRLLPTLNANLIQRPYSDRISSLTLVKFGAGPSYYTGKIISVFWDVESSSVHGSGRKMKDVSCQLDAGTPPGHWRKSELWESETCTRQNAGRQGTHASRCTPAISSNPCNLFQLKERLGV